MLEAGYRMRIPAGVFKMSYGTDPAKHPERILSPSKGIRIASSFQFPVSSFQFPASSFQFPASSFQLPASSFQFPVSSF